MTINEHDTKVLLDFITWLSKKHIIIPWQYVAMFIQERKKK